MKTFKLDDAQEAKALAWCKEHNAKHGVVRDCTGFRYAFLFAPTGLGDVTKVRCMDCDESLDVSNYDEFS